MRINLPVTQQNYDYPGEELLVSSTNTKGEITHCNQAFVRVSGYGVEELIGQPHNIIRHPDMPAEAYRDMWRTIGRGEPWTGLVKNRRKNGDHYWVRANVTPIMEGGKPRGYMSVRTSTAALPCIPSASGTRATRAMHNSIKAMRCMSVNCATRCTMPRQPVRCSTPACNCRLARPAAASARICA